MIGTAILFFALTEIMRWSFGTLDAEDMTAIQRYVSLAVGGGSIVISYITLKAGMQAITRREK